MLPKVSGGHRDAAWKAKAGHLVLWIALLLAFSPLIRDLGEHWLDHAWARYSLAFAPLLLWCIIRSPPGRRLSRTGLLLVAFSVLVELMAAKAAALPLARPVLPVAAIGLILMTGLAPLRTALLALWIVPVPHLLAELLGGFTVARGLFAGGAALLSGVGFDLQLDGRWILSGSQQLEIDCVYAGLPLFVLLAGLGWYHALRRRLSFWPTASCLALCLVCGVPIQLAAVALALVALGAGDLGTSVAILESGSWLLALSIAVFATERPRRSPALLIPDSAGRARRRYPEHRQGQEPMRARAGSRRFVLLDRDGTLVRDQGYTHRVADYQRLPAVVEGLQRLQAAGYGLAIVTNQSGIGRGYFSEDDFHAFQVHLVADLARFELRIEGSFFCPHRPDENCSCRKPEPGLLWQVRDELGADLSQSWVIGDGRADIEVAERAGCRGAVLVATGRGHQTSRELDPAIPRAADLSEAAEIILSDRPSGPQ